MSYLRPKSMLVLPKRQDARVNRSLSSCNANSNTDCDTSELIKSLICGEMAEVPRLSSKTVRVFISSTFSDMVYERNALMETVYPELKNFCKESYRLEFQMVDLRWGIREEAHDNHTIIDFCLREIENCRNVSIGPSFVILLGQKYGYRPFPPTIQAKEFEAIRDELLAFSNSSIHPSSSSSSLQVLSSSPSSSTLASSSSFYSSSTSDVALLNEWFKKDTNIVNHEYILQPISTILPDYGNEEDLEVKKRSEEQWESYRLKLQEVLRKGVTLCVDHKKLSPSCADKYFVSVTEYEIERGLFEAINPSDNCLCFMRTIENLASNSHCPRARPYLDYVSPSSESIDKSAQVLLNDLQNTKILNSLPDERNLEYFKVEWTDVENQDPVDNVAYLRTFCNAFREKMQWLINKSAQNIAKINSIPRMVEILQQFHMCRTRSESLRGREGTLKCIREFITASFQNSAKMPVMMPVSNRPLVIYGESGCGKTSVSAKVAFEVRNWFSQCQEPMPIVVFRFLGTTCYSCSIRLVLGSICWQIAMAYDLATKDIPTDYTGLVFYFHEVLKKSSREKPLVLILDGLDQLGPAHRAHSLAWLPCHLPEHVKLVVSTVPNKFGILATLKSQSTDIDKQNFIELHPLSPQLSFNLIKEWLRSSQMDLTAEQFAIVQKALSKCSLPLYTRLVFEEVKRWRSYYSEDQTFLEPSIEKIICSLLDRVELSHGQLFVSYTLSYLTASKEGLSDVELEDILSLDDHVLNDVFQHWLPPLRRIPPLLVPRLHSELSSYIIQRETNGSMVYYWYHAQFIDVARKRYLSSEPHRNYIHQILAHYFLGTWGGGKLKAYVCSDKQLPWMKGKNREGAEDRKVPLQPLVYGQSDKLLIGSDLSLVEKPNYNLRKLCELPFHLLESKMYVDLKDQVLFNYEWLYTKISALSLHDVLSDFTLTFQSLKDTVDLALLSSALRMSGSQVNRNPSSLAFDLMGRLLHCYSDHEKHSSIRRLLQQCDQLSLKHSSLVPLQQCFESPSSMVLFVLEGHNQVVSDLIIHEDTNELISVSKDGYLAFWDLVSGERSRTIDVSALNPGRLTRLFQSSDEKYLVVDSDSNESPAAVFDTKTGQLLHRCGAREPTQRRAFIAGSLFCRQKSIFDLISGEEIRRVHDFVESKSYVTCTITPDSKCILFDLLTDIKMFDLATGDVIYIFEKDNFNDVTVFRCTNDSAMCYCGYAVNCLVVAYNINKTSPNFGAKVMTINCLDMKFVPRNIPKEYGYIQEISDIKLCLNNQNKVLIDVCKSRLVTYDSETGDKVAMGKIASTGDLQATFTKSSFNYDGKLVLASSENNLHIWNSISGEHLQMIIIHSTVDFPFPWAVSKSRNVVATGSTINTAVRVWDLDKTEEKEFSTLKVYKNPIDCIACAPESRFVYVKSYFGLGSSSKGYKYFDRFAIDVWNISTGNWQTFLPFNRYGRLLEMKCSPRGNYLALLLSSLSQWYVVVADVQEDKVLCAAGHDVDWQCKEFELSSDWTYMVSCATLDQDNEVILWNVKKNKKIVSFREAKSPLFTLDGQYLLYIDAGANIIIYSLKNFAPAKCQLQIYPDRISSIPIKHHSILVTCFKETHSEVSVWDFHGSGRTKSLMTGVSRNGFSDISKNGMLAIDDLLQVYALNTGTVAISFKNHPTNSNEENKYKKLVKLTYDGLYCIWSDECSCSVKIGSIADGTLIAQANVHEKLVSLETMDYGYVMFCGREDGHIITMKLIVPSSESNKTSKPNPVYLAKSETDRRNYILDQDPCPKNVISQFDTSFQEISTYQKDSEMPSKRPNIARQLSEHAELPRLFTFLKPPTSKTSASNSTLQVPNSPSVLLFAQQNEFLSTHSLTDQRKGRRFLESVSTIGSHNPNSLPRRQNCVKADIRLVCSSNASLASDTSDSESASPVLDKIELTNRRSKSAQELFKLNKNLSKSSLDSLITDNKAENKSRNKEEKSKNVIGRHSLKLKDEKEKKTRRKLFGIWKFSRSNK